MNESNDISSDELGEKIFPPYKYGIENKEIKDKIADFIRTGVKPFGDDYLIHGAIENIYSNLIAPLQKEILDLKAEIEKRDEILNSLLENPYPTDIFPEIQTKVLKNIHEMLQEKFNLPLDRLTAHIGRLLRKPYQTEIKKLKGN